MDLDDSSPPYNLKVRKASWGGRGGGWGIISNVKKSEKGNREDGENHHLQV